VTALTRRVVVTLILLVVAATGAIGGEGAARGQHKALAAETLLHVQREHVCADESAAGEELNHAGVVIAFPDGTDTYCVAFEEDDLSGAELLRRTGVALVVSGFGGLGSGVCRIDDIGCSNPGDCFCQCRGADCQYWTYFELNGLEWDYLPVGASQRRVQDGDVDGWVWGNGRTPPGVAAIDAICSAAVPTPVPTPTRLPDSVTRPTATPLLPRAGVTPSPTDGAVGGQPTPGVQGAVSTGARPTDGESETATSEPRVVRQSSRPASEIASAERTGTREQDAGGLPVGLIGFGAVVIGLVAVGSGVIAKGRLFG